MKLQQKINIEEVAKLTLKNILSSKGIIYKHYENKIKKIKLKKLLSHLNMEVFTKKFFATEKEAKDYIKNV